MPYRIDYYLHDKKIGYAQAPESIQTAVSAARLGLLRHQAHYARIVDPEKCDKIVELIHRDVLP
jgi:hypothetical protein